MLECLNDFGMKWDSVCKMCRREGKKLFLKGERCYSSKCPMVKRKYPPGIHGPKGYGRLSEYGLQLREKQGLKRSYGIGERQMKSYFNKAKKKTGNVGLILLKFLEKRLDNVVYRAGFASSRRGARQIISYGNILVNARRVDIPSYQVKIGDVIEPKKKKRIIEKISQQLSSKKSEELGSRWFSLDRKEMKIKIITEPDAEDFPKDFDTSLVVEFYSR